MKPLFFELIVNEIPKLHFQVLITRVRHLVGMVSLHVVLPSVPLKRSSCNRNLCVIPQVGSTGTPGPPPCRPYGLPGASWRVAGALAWWHGQE